MTGNLDGFAPDDGLAFENEDADALRCAARCCGHGLALGSLSSGTNVAGAVRVAQALGTGHTVVTILCVKARLMLATAARKPFSVPFLESRGLPTPDCAPAGGAGRRRRGARAGDAHGDST